MTTVERTTPGINDHQPLVRYHKRRFRPAVSRAISNLSFSAQHEKTRESKKSPKTSFVSEDASENKADVTFSSRRRARNMRRTEQPEKSKWRPVSRAVSLFSSSHTPTKTIKGEATIDIMALDGNTTPSNMSNDDKSISTITNESPTTIKYDFMEDIDGEKTRKNHEELLRAPELSLYTTKSSPKEEKDQNPKKAIKPKLSIMSAMQRRRQEKHEYNFLQSENEELRQKIQALEMASFEKVVLEEKVQYLEYALDEVRNEAEEINQLALDAINLANQEEENADFNQRIEEEDSFSFQNNLRSDEYFEEEPSSMTGFVRPSAFDEMHYPS